MRFTYRPLSIERCATRGWPTEDRVLDLVIAPPGPDGYELTDDGVPTAHLVPAPPGSEVSMQAGLDLVSELVDQYGPDDDDESSELHEDRARAEESKVIVAMPGPYATHIDAEGACRLQRFAIRRAWGQARDRAAREAGLATAPARCLLVPCSLSREEDDRIEREREANARAAAELKRQQDAAEAPTKKEVPDDRFFEAIAANVNLPAWCTLGNFPPTTVHEDDEGTRFYMHATIPGVETVGYRCAGWRVYVPGEVPPLPSKCMNMLVGLPDANLFHELRRRLRVERKGREPKARPAPSMRGAEQAKEIIAANVNWLSSATSAVHTGWRSIWLAEALARGLLLPVGYAIELLDRACSDAARAKEVHRNWFMARGEIERAIIDAEASKDLAAMEWGVLLPLTPIDRVAETASKIGPWIKRFIFGKPSVSTAEVLQELGAVGVDVDPLAPTTLKAVSETLESEGLQKKRVYTEPGTMKRESRFVRAENQEAGR
jgi:hypothetical protein